MPIHIIAPNFESSDNDIWFDTCIKNHCDVNNQRNSVGDSGLSSTRVVSQLPSHRDDTHESGRLPDGHGSPNTSLILLDNV